METLLRPLSFCMLTELSFWLTVPKVQFQEPVYTGEESDGQITATVYRSGDIRHKSTARCYTRQGSAEVASDFDERPNTDASIITFLPGASVISQVHHTCLLSIFFDLSCIFQVDTVLIKETAWRSKPFFLSLSFWKISSLLLTLLVSLTIFHTLPTALSFFVFFSTICANSFQKTLEELNKGGKSYIKKRCYML